MSPKDVSTDETSGESGLMGWVMRKRNGVLLLCHTWFGTTAAYGCESSNADYSGTVLGNGPRRSDSQRVLSGPNVCDVGRDLRSWPNDRQCLRGSFLTHFVVDVVFSRMYGSRWVATVSTLALTSQWSAADHSFWTGIKIQR